MQKNIVLVRGGGDVASGTIQKLHRSGFKVLILEIEKPTSIRRKVSFSEAIYDQNIVVENIKASYAENLDEIYRCWNKCEIPVAVDPYANYIRLLKPEIVVDGILAKKNLGTNMNMAPITVALGPGFEAGKDVNAVLETNRGHNLGRLIFNGKAADNTGVPGVIGGYSKERVIYSPYSGIINNIRDIGDIVEAGETIAHVENFKIKASISGVLRGLIRDKTKVGKGFKIADVDPRISERKNCFTISDKARNIGGGVLEAVMYLKNIKNL